MTSEEKAELIAQLISDGESPTEAARIAAQVARQSGSAVPSGTGGTQLSRQRQDDEIALTRSPQNDHRRSVDYGNETPAEAHARWLQQEQNDPEGLFSGGQTSGGIFGNSAVASATYDPEALGRTTQQMERAGSLRIQAETLRVLKEISDQRQQQLPEPPRRQLSGPFARILGKKKQ